MEPPGKTLLDVLEESGVETVSVGKIYDIFAGRGIHRALESHGNEEGMQKTLALAKEDFEGFVFVNLVDFDMLYGHRQDAEGYAAALSAFDRWLPRLLASLRPEDRLVITADHGCDPGDRSTDHTREYIPLLLYGGGIRPRSVGTRRSFTDIGKTIAGWYQAALPCEGEVIL